MDYAEEIRNENAQLKQKLAHYETRIQQLEELIKSFARRQFAPASEKVSPDQLGMFDETEQSDDEESGQTDNAEEAVNVVPHQRRKKPRVSIPQAYPREDILYDIPEDEKVCPQDGTPLEPIGQDDHEQLDIIPAQIKVIRHRRLKYACPCCRQHVVTADKPKQPIEKSIASPGLLAHVAVQKYCDALPLYRQSEIFRRLGIQLDRTNLANWMRQCGELIQPLINLLQERLQQAACIHLDETVVQVLREPGKSPESKSYMWVMASTDEHPVRLFHYAPTRSQSVPLSLLSRDASAIMADGYEGYQAASDQYQLVRLGCWAHARRKFVEARDIQPKGKSGKADQGIAYIQKLYQIEKAAITNGCDVDERYRLRQEQAKPIIDKMRIWLEKSLPTVPPKTALGKALNYLHRQWDRLVRYLDNGVYPIDNNVAENAIRPFVVGRKNWLFSASTGGAKASANLYGLIETAKANQLNPYDYLTFVFKELPNAKGVKDIEAILPWNINLN